MAAKPRSSEPIPISLGTQSNPGRFGADGAARLINYYSEKAGAEGKIPWPLYAVDGLRDYANFVGAVGAGVRAMLPLDDDTLLTVAGQLLYDVNALGESVSVSTVGGITETGPVTMARNRNADPMVAIVVSGAKYLWQGGVLSTIADVDLPAANSVTHVNGYFVFGIDDGRMFSTGVDDITVSALDFARAEANPDGLMRVAVRGRDLLAFGNKTTEFWTDAGAETFPFTRQVVIDIGLLATTSVATVEQTLAFVAHDGTVRMLNGYQAVRISTHAVERAIAAEPDPSMIDAVAWEDQGHSFYAISGTGFTWVYDALTGLWHERQSKGMARWRCSSYARFDGKHIFGHYATPKLYEASQAFHDEAGDELICTVQPPAINLWPYSGILWEVHVDPVPGVGLDPTNLEQNVDPKLMVSTSKDGGVTFGGERQESIGGMGQRHKRVVMRNFGMFGQDGVVLRIASSAKVARGLTGLAVAIEKLRA
jgi:hypothetical protein